MIDALVLQTISFHLMSDRLDKVMRSFQMMNAQVQYLKHYYHS